MIALAVFLQLLVSSMMDVRVIIRVRSNGNPCRVATRPAGLASSADCKHRRWQASRVKKRGLPHARGSLEP